MVRRQEFLKVDEIIAATNPTTYNGYEHPPLRSARMWYYLRLLVGHAPLNAEFAEHLVEHWLKGILSREELSDV
ncbi:MAG: hypothetical protein HC789_14635 [Microcoleus sp. CSU_2_2]|nr:hypothetical protein [Microcoleus sp. SU_5_3]NJS11511.1 hypothetical protein [Microcoleus sp. CSU_2_2]